VIGVGALDNNNLPASYTNLADFITPNSYPGIWTFGGDYLPDSPDGAGGMLGVVNQADQTPEYVMWAGTSFASGVVAGVQACLLSETPTPKLTSICQPYTLPPGIPGNPTGQNSAGWLLQVKQG
jgi:subtilisin family serine protease